MLNLIPIVFLKKQWPSFNLVFRKKQVFKINDTESLLVSLSSVLQASTLGPTLLNIVIDDLVLLVKEVKPANFASDNISHV